MPVRDRLSNLTWSLVPAAPLAVARILTPDSSGVGTHRQLGLPPCTFLWLTGFPCPFCGMTTSWTHAAHGEILTALKIQPMGFLLFLVALGVAVSNLVRAILGRPAFRPDRALSSLPPPVWWTSGALLLVAWVYKAALVRGWI